MCPLHPSPFFNQPANVNMTEIIASPRMLSGSTIVKGGDSEGESDGFRLVI